MQHCHGKYHVEPSVVHINAQQRLGERQATVSSGSGWIYDAAGRLVRTLLSENKTAGTYATSWNGRDDGGTEVSSGVYFCALRAADLRQTKKVVLAR